MNKCFLLIIPLFTNICPLFFNPSSSFFLLLSTLSSLLPTFIIIIYHTLRHYNNLILKLDKNLTRTKFLYSSKSFEKNLRAASRQLSALFIGLSESSQSELSNHVFFFNSKYFKSYHGKTKILKCCPFFKKILISSPCYY